MSNIQTPEAENTKQAENAALTPAEPTAQNNDQWREVGMQFQTLGETLAKAVRTAWNDEGNRKRVQEMKSGLEAMLKDLGKAMDETAKSPQMQQVKSEAQRAAESFRLASEKTAQDMRPHILSALRQLNEELGKMVKRMEQDKPANGSAPAEQAVPPADPQA
jgi:hypothetical protein